MWAMRGLEQALYRVSHSLVVLSEGMKEKLLVRGVKEVKVSVIPDFIDTGIMYPREKKNQFSREYGLEDRFVIMYAGNVGIPHGVEVLVETAELLRDRKDMLFCIVGRGEHKERLAKLALDRGLENMTFPPRQPETMVPYIWASADVSTVTYRSGLADFSVPSKLLYIMASGRPAVVSCDEGSDTCRLVRDSGCGICVPPEDPGAMRRAILRLSEDHQLRKEMGERGFKYVKTHFVRDVVADRFEELFFRLVEG
jgi:colanic acid biosynthesis glycosyl transferase WcaI